MSKNKHILFYSLMLRKSGRERELHLLENKLRACYNLKAFKIKSHGSSSSTDSVWFDFE